MSKIEPTYATFEQAKWLKEKGLNIKVYKEYTPQFDFLTDTDRSANCVIGGECAIKYAAEDSFAAPEQWQIIEWFLQNHDIFISILCDIGNDLIFTYKIYSVEVGVEICLMNGKNYDTPQEAYSAAFDYIRLNNLI
jgi:hypothetical protein